MRKRYDLILTLFIGLGLGLGLGGADANAKRLGSGGSFGGKSSYNSPFKRSMAAPPSSNKRCNRTKRPNKIWRNVAA